jgi:superfamily II DNA or RNA helicase
VITLELYPNYSYIRNANSLEMYELRETFNYIRNEKSLYFRMAGKQFDPRTFLIDKKGKFATGLGKQIVDYLEDKGILYRIDKRYPKECSTNIHLPKNDIPLYEYQAKIVEDAFFRTRGIIQVPTGGGKTRILASLIQRLNRPTLVLVTTKDLLEQMKDNLENYLHTIVGTITAGKFNASDVTVATYQTIVSKLDLESCQKLLSCFTVGAFDEGHHVAADNPMKAFMAMTNVRHRYLLTATPERDDNAMPELIGASGDFISQLTLSDLIENNYLVRPKITLVKINHKNLTMPKETPYNELYNLNIVNNEERNNKIVEISQLNDKKQMIFVKQLEHGYLLKDRLENSAFLHGNVPNRSQILKDFNNDQIKTLIGTSLLNEGVDVPTCGMGINADANVSKTSTYQMIGRVLRLAPNKEFATYYDFMDKGHPCFIKASNIRKKIYQSEPCFDVKEE